MVLSLLLSGGQRPNGVLTSERLRALDAYVPVSPEPHGCGWVDEATVYMFELLLGAKETTSELGSQATLLRLCL